MRNQLLMLVGKDMWGRKNWTAACVAVTMSFVWNANASEVSEISIELNKVEASGKGCNMYFMLQNKTDSALQSYKLDLVLFDQDGVIAKQLVVETAPLSKGKTVVKAFPVAGMSCDEIGRLLLNDVPMCSDDKGAREDCTRITSVSSRTDIEFIK